MSVHGLLESLCSVSDLRRIGALLGYGAALPDRGASLSEIVNATLVELHRRRAAEHFVAELRSERSPQDLGELFEALREFCARPRTPAHVDSPRTGLQIGNIGRDVGGVVAGRDVNINLPRPSPPTKPRHNLPFARNEEFVGRRDELERLHDLLAPGQAVALRGTSRSGLTGMGGVGKTQIAGDLASAFAALARDPLMLGLPPTLPAEDTAVAVRGALEAGAFLLMSPSLRGVRTIPVETLPPEDALALLQGERSYAATNSWPRTSCVRSSAISPSPSPSKVGRLATPIAPGREGRQVAVEGPRGAEAADDAMHCPQPPARMAARSCVRLSQPPRRGAAIERPGSR